MTAPLPRYVREVLQTLRDKGFEAFLVGGCVRDLLKNKRPHDWDVATSALPEQTLALFPRTVPTGIRHGTVTVLGRTGQTEVTTFRREGAYADGRRPEKVTFLKNLEEDLGRRDFTINAMAMDEAGRVTDPFGGRADLKRGIIRCVGDPNERFGEDALRMLRAVRFSAQLGFETEPETRFAILRCAPLAAGLSAERVRDELSRILYSPRPERAEDAVTYGLLDAHLVSRPKDLLKELSRLAVLRKTGDERWAAFCAVLARHGAISDPGAFLRGLRLESGQIRACARGAFLGKELKGIPDPPGWKLLLFREGEAPVLCAAAAAEVLEGQGYRRALRRVLRSREAYRPEMLKIDGQALMQLGYPEGKELGEELRRLLEHVIGHPEDNRREFLINMAEGDKRNPSPKP